MKRFLYTLFTLLIAATATLAQTVKLSDKPEQFLVDLKAFMATGGPEGVKVTKDLESIWADGLLTASQRERLIVLCRAKAQKRYQAGAQFTPLFAAIYHIIYTAKPAVNPPDVDNLLTVAEKQFAQNDPKAYTRTVEAMRAFLQRRELYAAKYNKTFLLGGTFEFKYVEPGGTVASAISSTQAAADLKKDAQSRFDGWDAPVGIDTTQPKEIGVIRKPIQRRPIPAVVGPVVMISDAYLAIVANGDSALVNGTSGYFLLKDGVFVGKGGTFSWTLQGKEDRFVTLADYSMVAMNPRLVADDVTLVYEKGGKPIPGTFEYVSKKRYKNVPDQYPRFASYRNNEVIPNLGPGISYRGGLALAGLQLIGASADGQPATIIIEGPNKKTAFRVSSRKFEFVDSTITATAAQFTGYLYDADSLTHPAVQFKFDKETRVAWLNRIDRTGYARVPFADSYHKFYIVPEVVRWNVPRQKIEFYQVGAKREVPLRMESFDYFQAERYSNISMDYGFHPIQIIANYVGKTKRKTFLDDDLTNFVPNVNPERLRAALNRMVMDGYVDRDDRTGLMNLSRKGALYYFAYNEKSDYDNFEIKSYFNTSDSLKNATINLTDPRKHLVVRGVDRFVVSDTLKIYGLPTDKVVKIGKGRSLVFTGQLKSGNMRYNGYELAFDYDKFSLQMDKINSITFTPEKLAKQGRTDEIGGDIKYERPGYVVFAASDNKSGRIKGKKTTQRLVMPEGMTAYFDQEDRGDRRYSRKVYFKIPAIDNDSVGKGDISFIGTFHSDGILPPFQATLQTMPDQTLGFVHTPPASGYPIYGSKSNVKFTGDLTMSKKGLQGAGVLNHLAAALTTKEMLFMSDSLIASGETGQIVEAQTTKAAPAKKGQRVVKQPSAAAAYYPNVALNNYTMKWWPQADSMVIQTQKNNFTFFNATTKLEGTLLLRASGLFGNGLLTRNDSEVSSESIKFNKDGYNADNAKFQILSLGDVKGIASKSVLVGTDIDVDFDQVKGLVDLAINLNKRSVEDTLQSSLLFPYAAYKTNINRAQWNMKDKTIAMRGDVKTSTFTATGDEQEGLTFNAGSALYDIEKMTLNVGGVSYITAADARIYPDKGQVTIRRNGEMMAFKNARVEMDTLTLYHRMGKANIQIQSRTRFSGDATYLFATAKGDTTSIKMGSFELQEAKVDPATKTEVVASVKATPTKRGKKGSALPTGKYFTVASADIDENDKLMLAPKMQFKGAILVKAPDKDLALNGFIKPLLKKRPELVSGWIPFKEKVIETIEIPVNDKLKNEGDQVLVAGIHSRYGSPGIYPSFLSPKEDQRDDDIFRAGGYMRYDEKDKQFRIGTKLGTEGLGDEFDNTFLFNDERGVMTFRGALNLLATRPNQYLLGSGSARVNVDSSTYRINALLALDFPVPPEISTSIANKLIEANIEERNDTPADDDLNKLSDKLLPLIGKKAVDEYRNRAQNQHVVLASASQKLNTAMVLSDVNLRWSELHNAFYSVGKLGVSNIQNADINVQMDGYMEIRKTGSGDEMSLYVASSPDVWVFYDYRPAAGTAGQLSVVTSEQEINDRLTAQLKNGKLSKTTLAVMPGDEEDKNAFVERYEIQYKIKAKPKAAPKPKPSAAQPSAAQPSAAQPKPTETPIAKETDDDFGSDVAPAPTKPTKGKGKPSKAAEKATQPTATAQTSDPANDEDVPADEAVAEPAKTKTPTAKTKPAKGGATKGKPAVAKKEPPKPKEEKKDKEDEKEGF